MTLREILRVPVRRWPIAALASGLVLVGAWGLSRGTQTPRFKARSRVCLGVPSFMSAVHDLPWMTACPADLPTWISILESRNLRSAASQRLQDRALPGQDRLEGSEPIVAGSDGSPTSLFIEATGPSAQAAADWANAVAEAALEESRGMARRQAEQAQGKLQKALEEQSSRLRRLELEQRQIRERAGSLPPEGDLETEAGRLREEVLSEEARGNTLERRASADRIRLARLREEGSTALHLEREAIPRAASMPLRPSVHPELRAAAERLESVRRALDEILRKDPQDPAAVEARRTELRTAELELSRAESQAVVADLSAEELALRSDTESIRQERALLDPSLREHRRRLEVLRPLAEELGRLNREVADLKARRAPLEALSSELALASGQDGYLRLQARALPADAAGAGHGPGSIPWAAALGAAALAGFAFALLAELLDTRLRSDADVRRHLGYSVLALVPKVGAREVLAIHPGRSSVVSEVHDTLATVLLSAPAADPSRIVLVTGTNPQEGKTTVSINLAVALSLQGKRTLLVDGDLRVPAIHATLGLSGATGLSDLLAGLVDLRTDGVLQDIGIPNLKVMPAGPIPENPHELLDPARIAPVAALFRGQFDAVVIDTPPLRRVGDALKLAALSDAILFVVRSGVTDVRQATWAKRLLASVNARVTGAVLNAGTLKPEAYYTYESRRDGAAPV